LDLGWIAVPIDIQNSDMTETVRPVELTVSAGVLRLASGGRHGNER
jgi:hypothetical protein